MKKLIALAFIMALSATAGQAMPFAPNQAGTGMITKVAGGCGVGFHRGPAGGCRRNGGEVVVVPGAVVVKPKAVIVEPGPVVVAPAPVVVVPRGRCGGRGQHEVCVIGRGCRMVCN